MEDLRSHHLIGVVIKVLFGLRVSVVLSFVFRAHAVSWCVFTWLQADFDYSGFARMCLCACDKWILTVTSVYGTCTLY
jgi:hypothetical protein